MSFICPDCGSRYHSKVGLDIHAGRCPNTPKTCPECALEFPDLASFEAHWRECPNRNWHRRETKVALIPTDPPEFLLEVFTGIHCGKMRVQFEANEIDRYEESRLEYLLGDRILKLVEEDTSVSHVPDESGRVSKIVDGVPMASLDGEGKFVFFTSSYLAHHYGSVMSFCVHRIDLDRMEYRRITTSQVDLD